MMQKKFYPSVFLLAAGFALSTQAATNLPLPALVAADLQSASSATEISRLVRAYPPLSATIMAEAAALGIASPAEVMTVLADGLNNVDLAALVTAGVEAAPAEAAATVAAAFSAAGKSPDVIGAAAVNGIEAASPALTQAQVDSEAAKIMSALRQVAPGQDVLISDAIAAATNNPADNGGSVLAAAGGGETNLETPDISAAATNNPADNGGSVLAAAGGGETNLETADISPTGQLRRSFGRVPSFVNQPSEAQSSPN